MIRYFQKRNTITRNVHFIFPVYNIVLPEKDMSALEMLIFRISFRRKEKNHTVITENKLNRERSFRINHYEEFKRTLRLQDLLSFLKSLFNTRNSEIQTSFFPVGAVG